MELIDLRIPITMVTSKSGISGGDKTALTQCKCIKKYKSFQGTIKSMQIVNTAVPAPQPAWYNIHKKNQLNNLGGLCVASCGLDRYMRVHHVETGQCISKVYLKSRLNCLLFSKHEPVKQIVKRQREDGDENEVDDDQLSSINSDMGTDELWSDMETIADDHPSLMLKAAKRKLNAKLEQVASDINEDDTDEDKTFKKPK